MLKNIPKFLWHLAYDIECWDYHYAWIQQLKNAEHMRQIGMDETAIINIQKRALQKIRNVKEK